VIAVVRVTAPVTPEIAFGTVFLAFRSAVPGASPQNTFSAPVIFTAESNHEGVVGAATFITVVSLELHEVK
jgi:hypothetical protein